MILDEMVVISLEALEESHDSNVRFCLKSSRSAAWSQSEHSDGRRRPLFWKACTKDCRALGDLLMLVQPYSSAAIFQMIWNLKSLEIGAIEQLILQQSHVQFIL